MVKKFLKGLPRMKFIHIVASLEQVLDLNSTGFQDIVRRLKVNRSSCLERMIHKIVEAITTREEEDEEGLMVLMVITREEKLQTRPSGLL